MKPPEISKTNAQDDENEELTALSTFESNSKKPADIQQIEEEY